MFVRMLPCAQAVTGGSVRIASGTFVNGGCEDAREAAWGSSELIGETEDNMLESPFGCS